MISNHHDGMSTTSRIHSCTFAGVCPACLHEEPCPPLIVLAVLEQESRLVGKNESHTEIPEWPA